jgi:formylglycine-generating enzyme required for sulfatase activity
MSKQMRGQPNVDSDDEPSDEGRSTFAWEFMNDEPIGNSPAAPPRRFDDPTPKPRNRGDDGRSRADGKPAHQVNRDPHAARNGQVADNRPPLPSIRVTGRRFEAAQANSIREQLDRALDRWWASDEIPSLRVLRDGLLLLEAGEPVADSQRTLLLRAALSHNRGVKTALRHQVDAERVALVLAEALVEWDVPLPPERLPEILASDKAVQPALVTQLERSRILLTGEKRRRAQYALEMMPTAAQIQPPVPEVPIASAAPTRRPFRQLLLILLLCALLGFVFWQRRQTTPVGMVAMPAASYYFVSADGTMVAQGPVQLDAFFADRFEVTNRDYRTCVEQGACTWPVRTTSATRADYFTDPAFDTYPVVYVTHAMAESYCAWQGKRLPTAVEWQAAAGVAPTTGQSFRYPWGESFDPQRTNSAITGFGDTVGVGSFRPGGDSPSGAVDMAGNVAEWTASLVQSPDTAKIEAIVKGGSYASPPEVLALGAEMRMDVTNASPELGFRCARTHLLAR